MGKVPQRWWVGAVACPAGNPPAEDAFTFLKSCSPPGALVRGVRGNSPVQLPKPLCARGR